jgi:hypothetical protein
MNRVLRRIFGRKRAILRLIFHLDCLCLGNANRILGGNNMEGSHAKEENGDGK